MKTLFGATLLVAVGSTLFSAGWLENIWLMVCGLIALAGGITICYRYGLKTSKIEAK